MAKFKFLGPLEQIVPNGEIVVEGKSTLAEAFAALAEEFDSVRRALFGDDMDLPQGHYRILVNAEMLEFLPYGMQTRLNPEDIVIIVPPVAGG